MQSIKEIVLQIVGILEIFDREGYTVVVPHKYFSDRSESLQTLGTKLNMLNSSVSNEVFVGVITKTPTEALRHARQVLEFITSAEASP
jgi:hypothetical protein